MRKADNLPPYCAVVKKSRSLNFLDPSGPARPVTGVLFYNKINRNYSLRPARKHSTSATKIDQLMLYRKIIAVYSEIYTKRIMLLWAERKFLNDKPRDTKSCP